MPDSGEQSTGSRMPTQTSPRPTKRARRSSQGAVGTQPTDLQAAPQSPPPQPPPPPVSNGNGEDMVQPPPPPPPTDLPPPPNDSDDATALVPPPPPPPEHVLAPTAEEEEVEDAEYWERQALQSAKEEQAIVADLYLETINRSLLDFDFEKLCSVSLSNINIYACLVCGKYFQGRGKSSYAYFHAIDEGHRVFMNLEDSKVYILPDNYPVDAPSLGDIKYLLHPTYSPKQISRLSAPAAGPATDLQGKTYYPGFVGLNNIGGNDYINAVLQALSHVQPIRDYFLSGTLTAEAGSATTASANDATAAVAPNLKLAKSSELVRRFASLVRKLWNPRAFKSQVSPHEFLQEVNTASKGRFRLMEQGDPVEFLGWLLNQLHLDLNGGSRKRPSIISACFQGEVRIESQKVYVRTGLEMDEDDAADRRDDSDGRKAGGQEDAEGHAKFNQSMDVEVARSPFFLLAVELPAPPVFQDVVEKNIIPQVSIASILAKYDGVSFQEARSMIRRYKITKLPPFVILHVRRFTRNNFVEERNPTIVHFPIKDLQLKDYVDDPALAPLDTVYDLVANVTHEATPGTVRDKSIWRTHVATVVKAAAGGDTQRGPSGLGDGDDKTEEKWFQTQDLYVEEVNRQMLFLQESYIQIWKRKEGAEKAVASRMSAPRSAPSAQGVKRKASSAGTTTSVAATVAK
ncbi:unnamed protein product [Parajaminaea phylloscopi]